MSKGILPEHDTRSVETLVDVALNDPDDEVARNAVCALHWRGTGEVLRRAQSLCQSEDPLERCLGAEILGQLGVPERVFPKQCAHILHSMLDSEMQADVLRAIFIAFSHLHEPGVIAVAEQFVEHPDADVRQAVALAIMGYENKLAIELLIQLTNDLDSDVRDWATFALGTQLDSATPELCDALVARLEDPDDDTRGEAMFGLARRKDPRVVPAIRNELVSRASDKAIEAAEESESPELLPALIALRNTTDISSFLLEAAIAACARPYGRQPLADLHIHPR